MVPKKGSPEAAESEGYPKLSGTYTMKSLLPRNSTTALITSCEFIFRSGKNSLRAEQQKDPIKSQDYDSSEFN